MIQNYDPVLRSISLSIKEINGDRIIDEIPKLLTREETINLQLAVIKSIFLSN
jgi:hypothetical protein